MDGAGQMSGSHVHVNQSSNAGPSEATGNNSSEEDHRSPGRNMHGRRRSVTQTNKNVFYLERRGATMDRPDRQTEPSGKRRYRRHPKPDPNAPEKPPSAYVMFSNQVREELKGKSVSFTEIARMVGDRWKNLDTREKEAIERRAADAKEAWQASMSQYRKTAEFAEYQAYLKDFKERHGQNAKVSVATSVRRPSRTHATATAEPTSTRYPSRSGEDEDGAEDEDEEDEIDEGQDELDHAGSDDGGEGREHEYHPRKRMRTVSLGEGSHQGGSLHLPPVRPTYTYPPHAAYPGHTSPVLGGEESKPHLPPVTLGHSPPMGYPSGPLYPPPPPGSYPRYYSLPPPRPSGGPVGSNIILGPPSGSSSGPVTTSAVPPGLQAVSQPYSGYATPPGYSTSLAHSQHQLGTPKLPQSLGLGVPATMPGLSVGRPVSHTRGDPVGSAPTVTASITPKVGLETEIKPKAQSAGEERRAEGAEPKRPDPTATQAASTPSVSASTVTSSGSVPTI